MSDVKNAGWQRIQGTDGIARYHIAGGNRMNKYEVFMRLLSMYEQSERQVNRLMNEYDEELHDYEMKKIKMIIEKFEKEYEEAEA